MDQPMDQRSESSLWYCGFSFLSIHSSTVSTPHNLVCSFPRPHPRILCKNSYIQKWRHIKMKTNETIHFGNATSMQPNKIMAMVGASWCISHDCLLFLLSHCCTHFVAGSDHFSVSLKWLSFYNRYLLGDLKFVYPSTLTRDEYWTICFG